jgi:hypothetical protein
VIPNYGRPARRLAAFCMSAPRCEHNFFRPFRLLVTLTQILDAHGEPTDHVEIEGRRQGGMRTRIVTYARLLEQADVHLESSHGKTKDDPISPTEFAHATMRAAVAFLIDKHARQAEERSQLMKNRWIGAFLITTKSRCVQWR